MLDGHRVKYDRLKAIQGRAIANNHASLCLPVYRSLIAKNTELIAPEIDAFVSSHLSRTGRPGYNAIAAQYINDLGAKKAAALALSTTVNLFHRPVSFQSLAAKIGSEIANEWILQQEDPEVIANINKYRFKGVGTKRKVDYLRQTLKQVKGRALAEVPTSARLAIGTALLSFITRTSLVSMTKAHGRDVYTITATPEVLEYIESAITTVSNFSPVCFPTPIPNEPQIDYLIKPQRGRPKAESRIKNKCAEIYKAAKIINETAWRVNSEQYEFIRECSQAKHSILGLPYVFDREFPRFTKDMEPEKIKEIKRIRAKLYSERNINISKRARLLSSLSVLHNFVETPCYFEAEADFRGRLYLTSELVSYQGPDWLRSLWEFNKSEPINEKKHLNWLYIHTANCYGYSRISYADRISFIEKNLHQIIQTGNDPWNNLQFLEEASDPFRFLAACREIKNFHQHGWGYESRIPVQLDATSQGIQIWSTLANDKELMLAANVLSSGNDTPRDIYQELADTINGICMESNDERCSYFRKNPVDRKFAKSVLMILPYGGTRHAVMQIIDQYKWDPPLRARVWLSEEIWKQACDVLDPLLKVQQRASQAVSEHHRKCPDQTYYEWELPNGLIVRQRYMKDKRVRIRNAVGQQIHAYRVETDELDRRKSANAFPPNLVHSIDSSVLCRSLNTIYNKHNIKDFMTIHDCVGIHAANAQVVHEELSNAFMEIVTDPMIVHFVTSFICNSDMRGYNGAAEVRESITLSRYLFS